MFITIICFLILFMLSSCSNIAETERLIYVEPAPVARRVLIEDYTGQLCPNCPDATDIIHDLQQIYGEQIIPVAIHSDFQGIMEPEGLATEVGNTYFSHWNMEYKPAGLVSRLDGGGGRVLDKTIWIYATQYAISRPSPLDIRINATSQTSETPFIDMDIDVVSTQPDTAVAGHLQVWITEDSIVARQDSMGIMRPDYIHNHVLRATANGIWGEEVSLDEQHDVRHFHYTTPVQSHWNIGHLSVVAFIYTDDEVLQAARQPLTSSRMSP